MNPIDVTIKRAEIMKCDPRSGISEYRILFSDGKEKAIVRQTDFKKPAEEMAQSIISEIRTKLKEMHKSNSSDDGVLSGVVMIRFTNDDEALLDKLTHFFHNASENLRRARSAKLSYYDIEKKMNGFKSELV